MTRTRTQTALTKLVELVANVHGELEFVERLLAERAVSRPALKARWCELKETRDALYETLRQFDPALNPTEVASADASVRRQVRGEAK